MWRKILHNVCMGVPGGPKNLTTKNKIFRLKLKGEIRGLNKLRDWFRYAFEFNCANIFWYNDSDHDPRCKGKILKNFRCNFASLWFKIVDNFLCSSKINSCQYFFLLRFVDENILLPSETKFFPMNNYIKFCSLSYLW